MAGELLDRHGVPGVAVGFVDGNGNPIDGTVFLGIPGLPGTARAVAVLGATGRIRQYHWDGNAWQE